MRHRRRDHPVERPTLRQIRASSLVLVPATVCNSTEPLIDRILPSSSFTCTILLLVVAESRSAGRALSFSTSRKGTSSNLPFLLSTFATLLSPKYVRCPSTPHPVTHKKDTFCACPSATIVFLPFDRIHRSRRHVSADSIRLGKWRSVWALNAAITNRQEVRRVLTVNSCFFHEMVRKNSIDRFPVVFAARDFRGLLK